MTEKAGTVISLHRLGATVRLQGGSLASVPLSEVTAHFERFAESQRVREPLRLVVEVKNGRECAFLSRDAALAATPKRIALTKDEAFEEQMRRYLKSTEEWAPPDQPAPADRHFIRKKRRAAHFEARTKGA